MLVLDAPQVNPAPLCYGSCKVMLVPLHVLATRDAHTTHHLSADCVFILRAPTSSFRWIVIVQEQLLHFCDDVVLVEVVLRCEILAPLVEVVATLLYRALHVSFSQFTYLSS